MENHLFSLEIRQLMSWISVTAPLPPPPNLTTANW